MKKLTPAVILIVDQDPFMLTAVAAVLNMAGHECYCARDSEAALKAVRGLELDLIICDIDVDGDDGLLLCRELRAQQGAADIPLVFVSGDESPDLVRQAHDAGGTYYLRKPFDPDVLIDLVGKALWMPHLISRHAAHGAQPLQGIKQAPHRALGLNPQDARPPV